VIPHKPHVPKPMVVSPRDELVRTSVHQYLIRVIRPGHGEKSERVTDPAQALAAMTLAKNQDLGCLVYAIGTAYEEECMALVDAEFLRSKM
jgi:hypothetical protein